MNLRQAIGKSRRNIDSDINITPVMNIFVILIPFLLLTASFVKIAIIDLSLPSMEQQGGANQREDLKDLTVLMISIDSNGFQVKTSEKDYPLIRKDKSEFNYSKLSQNLNRIKKQYPQLEDVVISPASEIRYQVIVKVLDSCREVGFPNFSISG